MTCDVLSDVLRAVRLSGSVYFDFDLTSPWALEAPPSQEIGRRVMPGAQRVIEYHVVMRGAGWAHVAGEEPLRLTEGDLLMCPHGHAHVLSSAPGLRGEPDLSAFGDPLEPLPRVRRIGGGGPDHARIACAFLGCDERPFNPLLSALPKTIHLRARDGGATTAWLGTLMQAAVKESGTVRAGRQNVLARVSELLFVEAVRRYVEMLPPRQTGWLAGLRDPRVGHALSAIHGDPAGAWTVERLARVAGVSRSVFAERFAALVGKPPIEYLALWRMQLGAGLLAQGARVTDAADAVGYESEAAFSRAFKKLVGQTPVAWRRAGRAPAVGDTRHDHLASAQLVVESR